MAKYSERLIEKITALIEEGMYSITDICTILNISRKTFYSWKETKPELSKAIDTAIEQREEKLTAKARQSLQKKLEGYTLTETKLKYIPDEEDANKLRLKEKIVKIKEYAPDNGAIKIALGRGEREKLHALSQNGTSPIQIVTLDNDTRKQLEILEERLQGSAG